MKSCIYVILLICIGLFALTACGTGGGSLSLGGVGVRFLGPPIGRNSYQAVVYPASRPTGVAVSVQNNNTQ